MRGSSKIFASSRPWWPRLDTRGSNPAYGWPRSPSRPALNYRHHFHAGNFADLIKHAALLQLLALAQRRREPLLVLDTHAGAGMYDLSLARTGEAAAGVVRMMGERSPPVFEPLRRAVERLNSGVPVRRYPGSPWLIRETLRPADRYLACELRADDHAELRRVLNGSRNAEALLADGYAALRNRLPAGHPNALVLIDPPFERGDEYAQVASAVEAALDRAPAAALCVWTPLKDLETFDALIRRLEGLDLADVLIAEVRLRPLKDPLRLNGCALVLVNAPAGVEGPLSEAATWTANRLGDPGGAGRVWRV